MMNLTTSILFTINFFFFSLASTTSSPFNTSNVDIQWWCKRTPHPKTCLHYLSPHSKTHDPAPKHRTDFYKLAIKVAFELTMRAESHLKHLGPRCRKNRQHKAVVDCWKLYANTLVQLNRTLNAKPIECSRVDVQTWLSAALTNLHTCRKGFSDLRASTKIIQPLVRYNVSDLISNCLAINRPKNTSVMNRVPPVVASHEYFDLTSRVTGRRKLLQTAKFVVAKDGSGDFKTIRAAVNSALAQRLNGATTARIVIYVKAGVYNEIVNVVSDLTSLSMVGDGMGKTIITGSRSVSAGYTTFSSPTFSVFGDGFIASGITFRNTFGPGSQAVALLSGSDQSIFYRCSIEGYQDTLCVYTQRQFYRECNIYGTIDFIFGNAAVVIQNCNILLRRPIHGEANVVTAQGRTDPNQNTGIVIQFSKIMAAADLVPVRHIVKSYLGRPWMLYSRTLYLQNYFESIVDPAGWLPFNGNFALNTLYYAEFMNTGPGARILRLRVKWRGYHVIRRPSQVQKFTVGRFIAGRTWIRRTGIPFYATL